MNVDIVVKNFHNFLVNSDKILKKIETLENIEEIKNDFYQANWELLVESIICIGGKEYLLEYGEGADCNSDSSRVSFPNKQANIKIICKKLEQNSAVKDIISDNYIEIKDYHFNSFVDIESICSNKYGYIKLEHNIFDEYAIIEFSNIVFDKIKIFDY